MSEPSPPADGMPPKDGATAQVDVRRVLRRGVLVVVATLLGIAIGAVLLARTDLGAQTMAELRERARPGLLLAAIAVISIAQPCVALRWRALLPRTEPRPGVIRLTGILAVGLVFNYALPGPVGELVAAAMVRRRYGVPLGESLASLAVSRVLGLGSACLIAAVLWAVYPLPLPEGVRAGVGVAAVTLLVAAVALGGAIVRPQLLQAVVDRVLGGRTGDGVVARLSRRLHAVATELLGALAVTLRRGPRAYAVALGWAMGGHVVVATGLALAAWSIGADPPWAGVVFTYAAATAGALLLFLFPGSHVGWDVTFAAILTVATGMSAADAAIITVAARVQQSLILLLGLVAMGPMAADMVLTPGETPS